MRESVQINAHWYKERGVAFLSLDRASESHSCLGNLLGL